MIIVVTALSGSPRRGGGVSQPKGKFLKHRQTARVIRSQPSGGQTRVALRADLPVASKNVVRPVGFWGGREKGFS
jgi:hypothetical protein